MIEKIRTQDPMDFTVEVVSRSTSGTGFLVSTDGKLITCAHVISDAITDNAEVEVIFHERKGRNRESRRAKIVATFPENDDDVALLQLTDGQLPLRPEEIAYLGSAERSRGHKFQTFGYSQIKGADATYKGVPADGYIKGYGNKPEEKNLVGYPLWLNSDDISSGMSGAAVLDVERGDDGNPINRVVGVIEQGEQNPALAIDASVLKLNPFKLKFADDPPPLLEPPNPKADIVEVGDKAASGPGDVWNNAPSILKEWVPRKDLLKDLTDCWIDAERRITIIGLIGFDGEGKTSLARQWADDLLRDKSRPDGIFWWSFSEKPSVDEFFEAALRYISKGSIDPGKYPSANIRAQIIGARLGTMRYLFILDGLEAMQYQEGDKYGIVKSNDLWEFIEFFCDRRRHQSLCLITSSLPPVDLVRYTTYKYCEVQGLNSEEGRALLRNLGVKGLDEHLEKVVKTWNGHSLTLSLLGTYLARHHDGDISYAYQDHSADSQDERVINVLHNYDQHFTEAERTFLTLLGAFRLPMDETAFSRIFRVSTGDDVLNRPIVTTLFDYSIKNIIEKLTEHRILTNIQQIDEPQENYCIAHPLVRMHYYTILQKDDKLAKIVHSYLKDYYIKIGLDLNKEPSSINDLRPFMEAMHHACCEEKYYEAWSIYSNMINPSHSFLLTSKLGAYETVFDLMQDFFPGRDLKKDLPLNSKLKSQILSNIGFCQMSLGYLNDALSTYGRSSALSKDLKYWRRLSNEYQNLARLNFLLGELKMGTIAARKGIKTANKIRDASWNEARGRKKLENRRNSFCLLAWAFHLRGFLKEANDLFKKAETLHINIYKKDQYLNRYRGFLHAEHLRRLGALSAEDLGKLRIKEEPSLLKDNARRIAEANLKTCEMEMELPQISRCNRLLGDFEAAEGDNEGAYGRYHKALALAQEINRREILIDALLARGRWFAQSQNEVPIALFDLNNAMNYAIEGGYSLYEIDIRIAKAWAYFKRGDKSAAKMEAEWAHQKSINLGYFWGKLDSEKVLAFLYPETKGLT